MLCVSISKTKGQKWKENKGPLLDRGSGKVWVRSRCWGRWIITHTFVCLRSSASGFQKESVGSNKMSQTCAESHLHQTIQRAPPLVHPTWLWKDRHSSVLLSAVTLLKVDRGGMAGKKGWLGKNRM
jgi:hypothetical protein